MKWNKLLNFIEVTVTITMFCIIELVGICSAHKTSFINSFAKYIWTAYKFYIRKAKKVAMQFNISCLSFSKVVVWKMKFNHVNEALESTEAFLSWWKSTISIAGMCVVCRYVYVMLMHDAAFYIQSHNLLTMRMLFTLFIAIFVEC